MMDKLLDIIFPPKCPFCKRILESPIPICRDCFSSLPFTEENACSICGRPIGEFSHNICASCRSNKINFKHSFVPLIYKENARDTLLALKSGYHPYYAKAFAYLIADKILSSEEFVSFDYITYVPQNRASKFKRGYNQAELIAKELSRILNVECVPTLYRTDDGKKQSTLGAKERMENVKKCYFPLDKKFSGTVLLTDDIYTTGSTANHCSMLLKRMGFDRVYLAVAEIKTGDD